MSRELSGVDHEKSDSLDARIPVHVKILTKKCLRIGMRRKKGSKLQEGVFLHETFDPRSNSIGFLKSSIPMSGRNPFLGGFVSRVIGSPVMNYPENHVCRAQLA